MQLPHCRLPYAFAIVAALSGCGNITVEQMYPYPGKDGWKLCKLVQASEQEHLKRSGTYADAHSLGVRTCSAEYCAEIKAQPKNFSATVYPVGGARTWALYFFTDQTGTIRWGRDDVSSGSEVVPKESANKLELP